MYNQGKIGQVRKFDLKLKNAYPKERSSSDYLLVHMF